MQGLLQLTAEQRANMVELRRACLASLSDIINERNRIHMFLTVRAHPLTLLPPRLHAPET